MFTGLKPTLLGIVLYSGFSFSTFHSVKARMKEWRGLHSERDLPIGDRLAAGMAAGFLGQTVAYPLHIGVPAFACMLAYVCAGACAFACVKWREWARE